MEEPRQDSLENELEALELSSSDDTPSPVSANENEQTTDESDFESEDEEEDDLDLGNTIIKEIKEESYTCLICTCEVGPTDKVWGCSDCYRVYHISCVSHWSQKGSSTDDEGNWKCPACNCTHRKQKFQVRCWCKKAIHPQINTLMPNSCGQSCGAKLEGCPHRCTLQCHPGPHAVCNALGPPIKCHCGKHEMQSPCVLTPYVEGWKCDDICDELLPCEIHKCAKKCHDGLCGKCEEFVESRCYCGETIDFVKCHMRVPLRSFTNDSFWIGNFKCSKESNIEYDCGLHFDKIVCQPKHKKPKHCPFSPDMIKTCPCGQTDIGKQRMSCSDPIPTCSQICNKRLNCGHYCKWKCHEGECSPCYEMIETKCSCGYNQFTVPCKFLKLGNHATCSRKCSALLSCRRHRCNKICCPDEKQAEERERKRKKAIRNNQANSRNSQTNETFNIEASHVCLQVCGKRLSCGNPEHCCTRTCHIGPCPPCLASSLNDLVCHCGQTVVMAPVRCGVRLPPCQSQCIRELSCGHQQMPHNCHPDDIICSKCTKTVEKRCNCGKKLIKSMCYQQDVFCGDRCNKLLACGHKCLMTCHRGECVCKSICGRKKKYCDHFDKKACHFPSRCEENGSSCKEFVKISCKCGRITREMKCEADSEHESNQLKKLQCEIFCVLQERDDKLKEAFGVQQIPEEDRIELKDLSYSIDLLDIANAQSKWCLNVEIMFKEFMSSDKKNLDFKPMRRTQRQFLHCLAESYNLYSKSHDPEPKRSVFISKNQESRIPKVSLSLAIKVYQKSIKKSVNTFEIKESPKQTLHFNAILIKDCIKGITKYEIEEHIKSIQSFLKLNELKWINEDNYLLIPEAFMKYSESIELELKRLSIVLGAILSMNLLANSVEAVRIDENYNVIEKDKNI